jgi:hypothetical protein
MKGSIVSRPSFLLVLFAVACARKQPETIAVTVDGATVEIPYEAPPENIFVDLGVAATGWAKGFLAARSIGIYQASDASPQFRRMVQAATSRFAIRPIQESDFTVVCGGTERGRTSITSPTTHCTMKYVDAVLAFNSVRLMRDSGRVGLSITRVPTGSNKSERLYYCVTLGKKNGQWAALRSERMVDYQRCFRNIP